MNDALIEVFRHNAWATRYLLEFCQDLTEDQLKASTTGSFGDILTTFNHIVRSEASYLRRLSGIEPGWLQDGDSSDLDQIAARAEETQRGWEQFLVGPVDTERVLVVDDGEYGVRAGVLIAQAIHHGNHHREQICAILTSLGIQPPDVQAWEYAWKTGRIWEASNS
jgi:uncharacterized damage-inducible protein DinB